MRLPPPPPPGKVLGLYMARDAGAYYRITVPLRALESASWAHMDSEQPDGVTEEQLQAAETVILYRIGGFVPDVIAAISSLRDRWGIERILLDYDDAMFTPHPVEEIRVKRSVLRGTRAALELADGLIVQCEELRTHFRRRTSKPIAVVPNRVCLEDWPEPPPEEHPPVVVLSGSQSHRLDWNLVLPALEWLRREAPDVQLRVMGCHAPELLRLATDAVPWMRDLESYRSLLSGGAIGLCPLPRTAFNLCKSPIKPIEYSLGAGMAIIGSPTQYTPLFSGGRGLVVPDDDPAGWAKCLAFYLSQPERRRADAGRLRSWVRERYDVSRYAAELSAVYDSPGGSPAWRC